MSESLTISTVTIAEMDRQSMILHTPITAKVKGRNKIIESRLLLDSGATGNFINSAFAKKHKLLLYPLDQPVLTRNVDGTPNQNGTMTHFTWIQYQLKNVPRLERLLVTGLGNHDIILGLPWFKENNPLIDWTSGKIMFPMSRGKSTILYNRKNKLRLTETTIIRHITMDTPKKP